MLIFQRRLRVWSFLVVSINQMENEEIRNHHKEAQLDRESANFLYLTLAQLASSSVRGHSGDKDNDKEED